MTETRGRDRSTRVSRRVRAPRAAVFGALVHAAQVARWLPPEGMRGCVHAFEPRVGRRLRLSLTYESEGVGKSSADTDTVEGRFVTVTCEGPARRGGVSAHATVIVPVMPASSP